MIKIMMISGPALGHVARLSLIAGALLKRSDVSIEFVVPTFSTHSTIPGDIGCDVHGIRIDDEDRKFPALAYAESVEALFDQFKPDLIVQDCSPLRWLTAVRFPDCPRVVVTNAFLTAHAGLETYQKSEFQDRQEVLQDTRRKRGLTPLTSAFDLYDGSKVLLSDPPPLADMFGPWPNHVQSCGPLCMDDESPLPETLSGLSNLALFSMGSTGGLDAFSGVAKQFRGADNIDATVYVGSRAAEAQDAGYFDFCFDWLPLSSALKRARVCITHGGTGSTYLALSKGVPVLMSPTHANHGLLVDCLFKLGVGDRLETNVDMSKIVEMGEILSSAGNQFNHSTAPDNHARAILDLLKC